MSVQMHRRETRPSGGDQIKDNSGFVPGQLLYRSLVPYDASIVTLPLHCDCPTKHGEDSLMPDVRLGPIFPTSARPERCALYPSKRRAIAPRLKVPEADS
jgi:hypothetical protein